MIMAAKQCDGPNMELPMPFIVTGGDGKMKVNDDILHVLRLAKEPVSIISIVGKYRTGKSYIMNRFFNTNCGFNLGSTIQSETKGIWLWARPHPKEPKRTLILLDTEGLFDVEKGDETHDMKLFSLALLLSNCLVYNAVGTLDDVIVKQLHLVTELTEHIKTKEDVDEVGNHFNRYFPTFFLLLRDFFLDLRLEGVDCSPEEYMENALKLKPGRGKKITEYNEPRECIRAYFPKRKCYTMCKPVDDDEKLKHLDKVHESEIKKDFLAAVTRAIDDIVSEAKPFTVDNNQINGSRFTELATMYVKIMNEGGIPCISNVVDLLKNNECQKALDGAIARFQSIMGQKLNGKMPVELAQLADIQKVAYQAAIDHYSSQSLFDEDGEFMKILAAQLEKIFQEFTNENNSISTQKCNRLIGTCFRGVRENSQQGVYAVKGGYDMYKAHRDGAIKTYKDTPNKGPSAENALNAYLEATRAEEHSIISADKALSKKEKELAKEAEAKKREEDRAKAAEKEQQRMMQDFLRQQNDHKEMVMKLQQDFRERQDKIMEEHSKDMKEKEKEYTRLMSEGLQNQAEQYKTLITDMRQDRERLVEQHKDQMKQLEEYKSQHSEILDEMRAQRETSTQQIEAMQKRILELQKPQKSGPCVVM